MKFIYFDVGGVVVKDFSKTDKWDDFMKGLGINKSDYEMFDKFWEDLDVSLMDEMDSIVPLINERFKVNLPLNYDLLSEFVNRFEKNKSIWNIVDKAKDEYRIGLLTNMYPNMLQSIKDKGLLPKVKWDIIIDSSIEGVAKPNKEIFVLAQKKVGVNSKEILFVENSKSHVSAAKKLGWNTFFYDSSNYEVSSKKLAKHLNLK